VVAAAVNRAVIACALVSPVRAREHVGAVFKDGDSARKQESFDALSFRRDRVWRHGCPSFS